MTKMLEIEDAQQRALAAIDEIKYCAEQIAARMGVATEYDEACAAMENIVCRVDDLPMDIENIRDDATGDDE